MAPLAAKSRELVPVLKLLANRNRLLVLCRLAAGGEMPVTALARVVGLSPSALSQHLGRLRREGLVTFRRQGQTLFYALSGGQTARLLEALKTIYCPEPAAQAAL
jgi:DNA-binding transcriptional ArsR family regulator